MRFFICLSLLISSIAVCHGSTRSSRDSLFSITPEQMVFAAKLSEPYRKIYCHHFTMIERQEALDEWILAQKEEDAALIISPDAAVKEIAQQYQSSEDDPLCELGRGAG